MSHIEVEVVPCAGTAGAVPPQGQLAAALAGLQALALAARLHQVAADPAALQHQLGKSPGEALTPDDLLLAAKHLGLSAKRSRSSVERLALALMRDGSFVVLAQCDAQRVLLQRFGAGDESRPMIEPLQAFAQEWSGELIRAQQDRTANPPGATGSARGRHSAAGGRAHRRRRRDAGAGADGHRAQGCTGDRRSRGG